MTTFNKASFSKGEIAPDLYGRVDTAAYQIGLRTAKNAIVHPYGSISNRPGTKFVGPVKDHTASPRLIPFEFNTTDNYILEFGDEYMRVIRNDAHVTETDVTITAATKANPCVITAAAHGYSDGDEVFISDVVGMAELNGRRFIVDNVTTDTFSLKDQLTGTAIDSTSFTTYTSGGTVAKIFETTSPYAITDLDEVRYVQSADVMTLTHVDYPVYELSRTSHTDWTFNQLSIGASIDFPLDVAATATTTGSTSYTYKVTALRTDSLEESLPGVVHHMSGIVTAITKANPGKITTQTAHGLTTGATVYLQSIEGMTELDNEEVTITVTSTTTFTIGIDTTSYTTFTGTGVWFQTVNSITQSNPAVMTYKAHGLSNGDEIYYENNVGGGMPELSKRRFIVSNKTTDTFELLGEDSTNYTAYSGGGLIRATFTSITNGNATPNNTITWTTVSDADSYVVYKLDNGSYGKIGETAANTFTDDNIAADLTIGPPSQRNPFTNDNNPSAVGYFEQRRVFGGSTDNPSTSYYSQVGNFSNFNTSSPTQSGDAITANLTAREINQIAHFVPLNDLIVLTTGGEWRVYSGPDSSFSTTTLRQKLQSTWGSGRLTPIVLGNTILYMESNLARVRSLNYSFQLDGYTGSNLSLFASHLLKNNTVDDWCYSHQPEPRIYMVRDDGKALTLTFDEEQQVLAWTRWETAGDFEHCASLRLSAVTGDGIYFVVKRTIDGNDVRYIEKLDSRTFTDLDDAFFVDCGATYDGTATTTVSGLWWLEGATVAVLADGEYIGTKTVSNGKITLTTAASTIQIGLPYTCDIETLNFSTSQTEVIGKKKKIVRIVIRTKDSQTFKAGYDLTHLLQMEMDTGLITDDVEIRPLPTWNLNGRMSIRQDKPYPLTVLDVAADMVISP